MSSILSYFRQDSLPHIWCPGCGHGTVTGALMRAIRRLGLDKNKVCIVSGIGCSSRAVGYLDFDTVHTAHGRALAFATGIKLARPELKVVVMTGDGDCTAIGGNHFIHAARRNIGITAIVVNNSIYGMTGGQYSPTTPLTGHATTAPYGNIEPPFPICELAAAAGASYVARSTVYHALELDKFISEAIAMDGFSVVEAVSYCHTTYGRLNKLGTAADMMRALKDNSISQSAYGRLTPEEQAQNTKILRGNFINIQRPQYTTVYSNLITHVQGGE
jgi:2-oxoglutarate ferredoxin oxidoreductase subunit beta